ncbi:3-oxo-5-alpha-steroid 4-dehydrogenase [Purpureocillium takamizusanense]|uniref:Polyprenal reductase n=1 Tax=Purpureocillium takamizusanense TaxID=2060973 RepID=A0A9Q8Q5Q3_9HYPO|nr:3-oxo-5-alpha-steroid 4-dehydrogenase [Purpureocillium takamizusanense]UNI14138.1 3-oxo-5-alpha-steroid 4-dehydrogenase [Purpureocillium takamizusanense]
MDMIADAPPSAWCQAFFLGSSAGILALQMLPDDARGTLLDYGARRPEGDAKKNDTRRSGGGGGNGSAGSSAITQIASLASAAKVPHSWFWHFYFVSVSWSAFWAWQYLRRGAILSSLVQAQVRLGASAPSMELGRVFLAWLIMALQGTRRLYECFFVVKPGKSPMLFAHWALGIVFYTAMGISVWIHGSDAILKSWETPVSAAFPAMLKTRIPVTLAVILAAWFKQNECHRYLASLKKYTLPSQGMFAYLVCPHYTCECVIYLAISLMAAPQGTMFNWSVLGGLVFIAVNLGGTASGTKQWYSQRFGATNVAGRWNMVPFVF